MKADLQAALSRGERLGQRYALALPQSSLSGTSGTRLGRSIGSSLDFQEHRDYQPGDDLRRIDWNIYARSDRLALKLYREEVNPHLDLVLDGSRSMALDATAKAEALGLLAGVLATAATNAGCTHSVWLGQRGFRRLENDRSSPSAWQGLAFESTTSLAEDFQVMAPRCRPRSIRILVSDLMWPADPLPVVRRLATGASEVVVVQLLARDDTAAPEWGSLRLVDSESAEEYDLFVDAEVAEQYRRSLAQHIEQWRHACRLNRAQLASVEAESLVESQSFRALEESGILVAA